MAKKVAARKRRGLGCEPMAIVPPPFPLGKITDIVKRQLQYWQKDGRATAKVVLIVATVPDNSSDDLHEYVSRALEELNSIGTSTALARTSILNINTDDDWEEVS